MAAIDFPYPAVPMPSSAGIAISAVPVNGTSDYQGWACKAEEDVTITAVACNISSRTGTPGNTGSGCRLGIVYIDATTGFPSVPPVWANATFSGSAGTAYQDFNATSISVGTFLEATLTTSVTLQKGTIFGILFDPVAGTWDTGNFLNVVRGYNTTFPYIRFPYGYEITATNFAMANTAAPIFYYKTSTRKYGYPYQAITNISINNTSTPDEIGMYFRVPAGTCSTYKISGLRLGFAPGAQDFNVLLYDTDGTTVLHQVAVDGNIMHTVNGAAFDFLFNDDVLSTLTAGSYYRITVRPSTGSSMGTLQYITFPTSADKETLIGNADDVQYTSRKSSGAWTQTTDRLITMQVLIIDMTQATGGSTAANPLAGYIL